MPRLIPLSEIEKKLPPFVKIHPETYRGARYKAKFTDMDYGEEFEAGVDYVIRLQSGCKKRSDNLRSLNSRHTGPGQIVPISEVIAKLPTYLELDASTYKGVRHKALFYDKQYDVKFEMIVANVIRDGKGYCKRRQSIEFTRAILTSPEALQEKCLALYGTRISYLQGYRGNRYACDWMIDGKRVCASPYTIISGNYFDRPDLERWKALVMARDMFQCCKCGSTDNPEGHHLLEKLTHPAERFNVNNGVVLCFCCHQDYHGERKFNGTLDKFLEWLGNPSLATKLKERLSAPRFEAPRVNPLKPNPRRGRQSRETFSPPQSIPPPCQTTKGSY